MDNSLDFLPSTKSTNGPKCNPHNIKHMFFHSGCSCLMFLFFPVCHRSWWYGTELKLALFALQPRWAMLVVTSEIPIDVDGLLPSLIVGSCIISMIVGFRITTLPYKTKNGIIIFMQIPQSYLHDSEYVGGSIITPLELVEMYPLVN